MIVEMKTMITIITMRILNIITAVVIIIIIITNIIIIVNMMMMVMITTTTTTMMMMTMMMMHDDDDKDGDEIRVFFKDLLTDLKHVRSSGEGEVVFKSCATCRWLTMCSMTVRHLVSNEQLRHQV